MKRIKKAAAVVMVLMVLFSTGCATLQQPQGKDKYREYSREEAVEENLKKYNDPEYLKKVLSNTYIPQGYYSKWEPFDIKKEKVPENSRYVIVGTVTAIGMIAGGIWGYNEAQKSGQKMGMLSYIISVPCGILLGMLPGFGLSLVSWIGSAVSGGK